MSVHRTADRRKPAQNGGLPFVFSDSVTLGIIARAGLLRVLDQGDGMLFGVSFSEVR